MKTLKKMTKHKTCRPQVKVEVSGQQSGPQVQNMRTEKRFKK